MKIELPKEITVRIERDETVRVPLAIWDEKANGGEGGYLLLRVVINHKHDSVRVVVISDDRRALRFVRLSKLFGGDASINRQQK